MDVNLHQSQNPAWKIGHGNHLHCSCVCSWTTRFQTSVQVSMNRLTPEKTIPVTFGIIPIPKLLQLPHGLHFQTGSYLSSIRVSIESNSLICNVFVCLFSDRCCVGHCRWISEGVLVLSWRKKLLTGLMAEVYTLCTLMYVTLVTLTH